MDFVYLQQSRLKTSLQWSLALVSNSQPFNMTDMRAESQTTFSSFYAGLKGYKEILHEHTGC